MKACLQNNFYHVIV